MKKILSIIAFAVLAILLSVTAFAADSDIVASGYCGGEGDGKNLTWSLTEYGILTISGNGAMADYSDYGNTAPWISYSSSLRTLVLENGITEIGSFAFYNCNKFKGDLVIPNSVTKIGAGAFASCSGFNGELIIGKNVEEIREMVFTGCSNLKGNSFVPASVNTIGIEAFTRCGINNYYFIGDAPNVMMNFFDSADTVYYPSDNDTWTTVNGKWNGYTAVAYNPDAIASGYCGGEGNGTNLTWTLTNDGTLTISGEGEMADYNEYDNIAPWIEYSPLLETLVLGNGITTIGECAFYDCKNFMGALNLPESLKEIEDFAFFKCEGFTGKLKIPKNVTLIDSFAFWGCTGFNDELEFGEKVEIIGHFAFEKCTGFNKTVVLPESIREINLGVFINSGISEFYFEGNAPIGISSADESDASFGSSGIIYYPSGNSTWEIVDGKWNGYTAVAYSDEPDAALSISSAKGISGGGTKTVSIILSENSNAAMAQFAIKYDSSALELVSASAGELMKDALVNTGKVGTVFFGWDSQTPVAEGGTILELTFKTAEDAKPGEYPIEIDTSKEFVFSRTDSSDLNIEIENGKITVIEGVYGDLNGDGKVNIKDAYFARLVVAKLIKPTEEQILLGDVDLDGKISAIDANILRKYSVQIIEKLPVS
ncbi:MAG: hypothetical protein E7479_05340 [Ruminococcaceae bacterium]|nr:hypothetical protein [Oscillospiraceae bacterium]